MPPLTGDPAELAVLRDGRAAIDLTGHRVVRVEGGDARSWLGDLVTADVQGLVPGEARRSLLLDPTGHIRADLAILADDAGYWVVQAPDQPRDVAAALAPYVLSADVRLDDASADVVAVASPDRDAPRPVPAPSNLPIVGAARIEVHEGPPPGPPEGRAWVGAAAVEARRILDGSPRMTVDFDEAAIPAAVGLEGAIDLEKGCFLGQESVARVRNLGHPPVAIRHLRADGPVDPGEAVLTLDGDEEVGHVTSAASDGAGATVVLATVRWRAIAAPLRASSGPPLVPVGSSD